MTTKPHWHVHSYIPGYLCDCAAHYPLETNREIDEALRLERDDWLDYKYQSEDPSHIRITGSIRKRYFDITDTESLGWYRGVEAWECSETECYDPEFDRDYF